MGSKAKTMMTAAALATLRGDVDAVEKTEVALAALNEQGSKEPQPPAPAELEVVSSEVPA